ncbi:hypothetical protein ABFS82_04G049400 [Erythranthe guttata]
MESKRVSYATIFIGLFCIGLLSNSVAGDDAFIYQGPCFQFQDCNKQCTDQKEFKDFGGECIKLTGDGDAPLVCVCFTHH